MKNYDCIIIGAGPAGISSAIYLQRSNLNILLIEKNAPGGRMLQASEISNYAGMSGSGAELAEKMFSMIDLSKVDFEVDEVTEVIKLDNDEFDVVTRRNKFHTKKIILATGFINRPLKDTNEADFVGRGISYCALCDAPLVKNKTILCYGSGAKTLQEVNYLATLAEKVYLITSSKDGISENIEVLRNSKIIKFNDMFGLNSVTIEQDGVQKDIECQMAFIFNGYTPGTKFVENLGITNKAGLIEVNQSLETNVKNIYAVGDVNIKDVKQVATAVGDGAYAASKILR